MTQHTIWSLMYMTSVLHITAGLRSLPGQAVLSRLAACPTVSLLASYDHVNTPILWDEQVWCCRISGCAPFLSQVRY